MPGIICVFSKMFHDFALCAYLIKWFLWLNTHFHNSSLLIAVFWAASKAGVSIDWCFSTNLSQDIRLCSGKCQQTLGNRMLRVFLPHWSFLFSSLPVSFPLRNSIFRVKVKKNQNSFIFRKLRELGFKQWKELSKTAQKTA